MQATDAGLRIERVDLFGAITVMVSVNFVEHRPEVKDCGELCELSVELASTLMYLVLRETVTREHESQCSRSIRRCALVIHCCFCLRGWGLMSVSVRLSVHMLFKTHS